MYRVANCDKMLVEFDQYKQVTFYTLLNSRAVAIYREHVFYSNNSCPKLSGEWKAPIVPVRFGCSSDQQP